MSARLLVAGVIGIAVGIVTENPQAGYAAFSLAYGATGFLDPKQRVTGPRLEDLKIQVSSYAVAIPKTYGSVRVAGNVIWSSDLIETRTETSQGGKGGPGTSTTSFSYSASFAVLIAEGEIAGIRRIWADTKLVYDSSATADAATQAASALFAERFVFYTGSETQTPDPTMEAALGVGNVPGYRGCAYIVFTDCPVGDFGNRIPSMSFETGAAPLAVTEGETIYEPLRIHDWSVGGDGQPVHGAQAWDDQATNYRVQQGGSIWNTTDYATAVSLRTAHANHSAGAYSDTFFAYRTSSTSLTSCFPGGATLSDDPQTVTYLMAESVPQVIAPNSNRGDFANFNYGAWGDSMKQAGAYPGDPKTYYSIDNMGQIDAYMTVATAPGEGLTSAAYISINSFVWTSNPAAWGGVWGNPIEDITVERIPAVPQPTPGCPPGDPCVAGIPTQIPDNPGFCINCAGDITPRYELIYTRQAGTFKQLCDVTYRSGVLYQNALGPVLLPSDPNYSDSAFWSAARADALAAGTLHSDISTPVVVSTAAMGASTATTVYTSELLGTTLDAVVSSVWADAGGDAAEIDVTSLSGIVVDGYVRTGTNPARAAIEPLRQAYWFDLVESGEIVKAVLRGGASALTIDAAELGAAHGEATEPVLTERGQETELPATVDVGYLDRAQDYQTNAQSARRVTTGSRQQVSSELAIVLTNAKAAQVANVLMYDAWTQRNKRVFATARKYARLEPTDVVTLTDGGFTYLVRVTQKSEDAGVCTFTAVDEDASVYTPPVITGGAGGAGAGEVRYDGPMKVELIDSPILLDTNDDPGFYVAASGYRSSWAGGRLFESSDGGASFVDVLDATATSTIGQATTVLGNWTGGNIPDEANTVTVSLRSGTLASITQAQLLGEGNAALLGDELIQFRKATFVSAGVYKLSGLLRGRRGTEQHMGTHGVGDRFVLFSRAGTYRVVEGIASLNVEHTFRAASYGSALADQADKLFTNTGAGIKPLAPVHLHCTDVGGGTFRAVWVRRTRLAAPLADYIDAPLGETSESYLVEVLAAGVVVSSVVVGTPTADVSASAGNVIRVRQISSRAGPGFAATVTV